MTLPAIETARNWSGLTAVDSDGEPLGRITDIYLDHDTGLPEWALVATPRRRQTFVPLAGAARKGDRVAVAVPKAAVSDAPAIQPRRGLSDSDAARLYGHYVGTSGDRKRERPSGTGSRSGGPAAGGDGLAREVGGGAAPGGQGPSAAGRAVGPRAAVVAGRVGLGAGGGCDSRRAGPAPPRTERS
jgi:hypothetical protein